jgi:hypothetical protein
MLKHNLPSAYFYKTPLQSKQRRIEDNAGCLTHFSPYFLGELEFMIITGGIAISGKSYAVGT